MKRFLIALFAIALLSSVPLLAQQNPDDQSMEPSSSQLQGDEPSDTAVVQDEDGDVNVDADFNADLNDDDADLDADLDVDSDLDDDYDSDELPATGSELPLAALLGLGALTGAAVLRFRS